MKSTRALLEGIARASLRAVEAESALEALLTGRGDELAAGECDLPPAPRIFVFALGKAAAPMARAAERWAGERLAGGLVVTKDGHGVPLSMLPLLEAAHPVPDERSSLAGQELLRRVSGLGADDVALMLLSGGASSLLSTPARGISRADLARVTELLLSAGASIDEMNAVRKHLGRVGGGQLAAACGAGQTLVLAVSDVRGDRLDVIGSGPCAPDPTSFAEAAEILQRRVSRSLIPPAVSERIRAGTRGEVPETPGPEAEFFARVHHQLIANNAQARRAARAEARRCGLRAVDLGECLVGEAREVGRRFAALGGSLREPVLLIAGGETTVTIRGPGRGGRNQELALAAALELAQPTGFTGFTGSTGSTRSTRSGGSDRREEFEGSVSMLALGSDGSDGPTTAAGAFVDSETVARGNEKGLSALASLEQNDSFRFFSRQGGVIETGPTGTNVMDLLFVLRSSR